MKKLKVAVLLYGQPRTFRLTGTLLKSVFEASEVDVDYYLFSWNGNQTFRYGPDMKLLSREKDCSREKLQEDLTKMFQPKVLEIESEDIIDKLGCETNVQGLGQAYAFSKVIELASKSEDWNGYDWVFVTRYDLICMDLEASRREGHLVSGKVNYIKIRNILDEHARLSRDYDFTLPVFAGFPIEKKARSNAEWDDISNSRVLTGYHDLNSVIVGPWPAQHPYWFKGLTTVPDWIFSGTPRAISKLQDYCNFKLDILDNFVHCSKELKGITWQEWGRYVHRFLEGGLPVYLNLKCIGFVGDGGVIPNSALFIFREEHEYLGIDPNTEEGCQALLIRSIREMDYRASGVLEKSKQILKNYGLNLVRNYYRPKLV